MFSQLGQDMAVEDQRIFIILTGTGISIVVLTMSALLITRATKAIKKR